MTLIPLVYFTLLTLYFCKKLRRFGMDAAASTILVIISICSVMIDINDLYGSYGINEDNTSLPTVTLYCIQWTLILLPLHIISNIPLQKHIEIKKKLLYILAIIMGGSSILMVIVQANDIRDALIMDMVDVYSNHIKDISTGAGGKDANWFLLLPQLFISTPFPTLALFLWFYMKAFMNAPILLSTSLLFASIVQAILAIVQAGRSAVIFWSFDFFLLFFYFYPFLSPKTKRAIFTIVGILGTFIGTLFITITISRFDAAGGSTNALDSLFGYAGQHVNNFCTMITEGGDTPYSLGRIFPFTSKLMGQQFDLISHYEYLSSYTNVKVNVFDTFGGELYLDLGWMGFIGFFIIWMLLTYHISISWKELQFHNIFILIILIAFFTRGLFSWPFMGHYTTFGLILTIINCYLYKYKFQI